jgi:uncharacterized membrane-anchored protein YhcB (DUF1043 family)
MILLEVALALVLVWLLACCSLILGGCISVCALRLSQTANPQQQQQRVVLYTQPWTQKSDLYLD